MARRRLLTLLAASALLTGVTAGPAAALDLVDPESTSSVETTTETAVETVEETVEDVASVTTSEPVAAVVDAVPVETAPETEAASPSGDAAPSEEPAARGSASDGGVVAAGGVTSAPPIDLLVGLGGSEQTARGTTMGALETPSSSPAAPTDVEAPLVAPAPSAPATTSMPSALAQAVDDLPEESAPALALVALAALLAAGAGTVQSARAEAII